MSECSSNDSRVSILRVAHRKPNLDMPAGACDCHVHVFGPVERFPYSPARPYTPAAAVVEDLIQHQGVLGLQRVIVVQPSVYGTDNSCTLDAVARLGGDARGVAVIDETTTVLQLQALAEGGTSGIRLNLAAAGMEAAAASRALQHAQEVASQYGWHIQLFTSSELLQVLRRELKQLSVPLVLDHYAGVHARAGVKHEGFKNLVGLLSNGNCYVKLSAPYLVSEHPTQDDVAPLAKALAAVDATRLLWGSNWPHPLGGVGDISRGPVSMFRDVDDGLALMTLARWLEDDSLLQRVLVDNPAQLYGFEALS